MHTSRNQWVILREYYNEKSPAGKEIFNINHILSKIPHTAGTEDPKNRKPPCFRIAFRPGSVSFGFI